MSNARDLIEAQLSEARGPDSQKYELIVILQSLLSKGSAYDLGYHIGDNLKGKLNLSDFNDGFKDGLRA